MIEEGAEEGGGRDRPAWHALPVDDVTARLESDPERGLARDEARRRREEQGPNRIRSGDDISPVRIFVDQFRDFLIYLLILAAALSVAVGFLPGAEPNWVDAILIGVILVANGVFGFVQD